MATWHDATTAVYEWLDAPANQGVLDALLVTAKDQCLAYAPALADANNPPVRYVQAQLMQARALWLSTESNSSDQIGSDGFTVTVYPMDRVIKNILRPKRGVPIVG